MNIVNMKHYIDDAWSLQDRYWSGLWSNDVEWLEFDSNKNTLFVQTHGVYGTGYSYLLNLLEKKILQKNVQKEKNALMIYMVVLNKIRNR